MTEALTKARAKLAEIKASGGKVKRLDPIEKAMRNPTSLRDAINAMCWHCCGAGADGQDFTRATIRECSVAKCPLHPHRPHQPITTTTRNQSKDSERP